MLPDPPPLSTTPLLGRAETPITFIQAIAAAYAQRGLRVDEALAKAQIEPKLLKKNNARVTAMQMELMSGLAMQELDDEGLGWFSRRLPWGSYGMLVRASITSPTLGVALTRWCRHHGLLTDDIRLHLSERSGVATLQLDEVRDLGAFREFCVVSVLRNALGVACWLTDSRIPLMATQLRFAPPAHRDSYRVLFDGPTTFEASENALQFDAGYLDRPYRRDRLLVEKVRQTLAQHPEHSRNADDLAAWLNMSVRTLHRQLQEEGASLQQLKDNVREQRARVLLLRTTKPLKQIATEVGFSNEKSFMRAFKSWTGKTPESFRQSA
jgi:AraC-like DNA-binding protein